MPLFLHLQPKKSPRRGSWTTAVSCHGRLTFQRRRPRLATKPLATWLILALKIRPQSAKASAGSQPLRRNELDARAISAARTLLDAKEVERTYEVERTHDGAWTDKAGRRITSRRPRTSRQLIVRLKGDEYVSKTIEKMLILLLQISKFRLRRLVAGCRRQHSGSSKS